MKKSQLPHLISLLEDPDPFVRSSVLTELDRFDESLERQIFETGFVLDEVQSSLLYPLLQKRRRELFSLQWEKLTLIENDYTELEQGFTLISEFMSGPHYPVKLTPLLDTLADEYTNRRGSADIFDLADFLFKHKAIGKPIPADAYNPLNSNLVSVIERGYGLPISLCAVFMLTGRRLGLSIEGCNYPGHFLARVRIKNSIILIDCYNGGIQITEDEFPQIEEALYPKGKQVIHEAVSARTILRRVLYNMINAYSYKNDKETADFLFAVLEEY